MCWVYPVYVHEWTTVWVWSTSKLHSFHDFFFNVVIVINDDACNDNVDLFAA